MRDRGETAIKVYTSVQTDYKNMNQQWENPGGKKSDKKYFDNPKGKKKSFSQIMHGEMGKVGHTDIRSSLCSSAQHSSRRRKHISSMSKLSYDRVNWY